MFGATDAAGAPLSRCEPNSPDADAERPTPAWPMRCRDHRADPVSIYGLFRSPASRSPGPQAVHRRVGSSPPYPNAVFGRQDARRGLCNAGKRGEIGDEIEPRIYRSAAAILSRKSGYNSPSTSPRGAWSCYFIASPIEPAPEICTGR
jgi:hypothetical protein